MTDKPDITGDIIEDTTIAARAGWESRPQEG